ncbi:MAG TPA: SDR family oxidoreductase [Thermoanaerobaculales bacterium]|nr:SDR family oxidoreductase [Thermoanaerobaculales bacterium]HPA80823.1 SDR family oxidoreductase [Thermoanaerobaculales bacterium]HQL28692.1 SDR family oxidoreductase [Thermoanaerobaculales bacterium]HQN95644.1 SDR family oxidoreductase [Thermoanaerobaculales bacterium]HQP44195.1 SDR family oxidoreductase [Thermoanaerobaculales bacterium]
MKQPVLILGGDGMLGHKLFQTLRDRFDTFVTLRAGGPPWRSYPFDPDHGRGIGGVEATDFETVATAVARARPEVVVNCIGVVKQRAAAADAEQTMKVNAQLPQLLARLCGDRGCRLIQISTDCVFSGLRGGYTEDDQPDPVDLYGRSKLLGEVTGDGCLTLRTSMIGRELSGHAGLLEWLISRRGGRVRGFRNAVFSGLATAALSRVIAALVSDHGGLEGLFHVAGAPISKLELLERVNRALGLGIAIDPVDEPRLDRSLDGSRFAAATGIAVPSWDSMIAGLAADPTPYDEWRGRHEAN